jgi:Sec-independent protein translocase protein TatA
LGDAVRELAGAVGSFGAEVRAGMNEREQELHDMVEERTAVVAPPSGRHAAARPARRARRAEG